MHTCVGVFVRVHDGKREERETHMTTVDKFRIKMTIFFTKFEAFGFEYKLH